MDLISIGEIEDVQSVSSPHEEELKKLGGKRVGEFRELGKDKRDDIFRLIGAKKENLKIGEEWALTKEFFPEVKTHISYHYYGEEFKSAGEEDQLRFLFSGEKIRDVTGEDLAGMIDITLKFIGRYLSGENPPREKKPENKEKFFDPRREALNYLDFDNNETMNDLARFLGSRFESSDGKTILWKEFFPEVKVGVELKEEEFIFKGKKLEKLTGYELSSLGAYTLNHIIRYIANVREGEDLPEICRKVFPRYSD